mmetsp:Transcript_1289/g.2912  ORF Transcript_1289/g.2912 Transcript_1289/m.2912 type:complete len:265 (-) Transcript_1289:869-1663(-)
MAAADGAFGALGTVGPDFRRAGFGPFVDLGLDFCFCCFFCFCWLKSCWKWCWCCSCCCITCCCCCCCCSCCCSEVISDDPDDDSIQRPKLACVSGVWFPIRGENKEFDRDRKLSRSMDMAELARDRCCCCCKANSRADQVELARARFSRADHVELDRDRLSPFSPCSQLPIPPSNSRSPIPSDATEPVLPSLLLKSYCCSFSLTFRKSKSNCPNKSISSVTLFESEPLCSMPSSMVASPCSYRSSACCISLSCPEMIKSFKIPF